MRTLQVQVGDVEAMCVYVAGPDDLQPALEAAHLPCPSPVLVVVGGAGGVDAAALSRLTPVFTAGLVPAIELAGAVAVDGGTDSGVMRLLGQAREAQSAAFPLVGVAVEGTVRVPGSPSPGRDAADLEPHHTHFLLVPGDDWGDEAGWIAATATHIAAPSAPSVTVLVNGGDIAYRDAAFSLDAGRPVIAIRGSGRAADEIAAAVRGEQSDQRARELVESGLVSYVDAEDSAGVREAVALTLRLATG